MPASTRSRSRRDRQREGHEARLRRHREAQEAAYEAARSVLERAAARRDAEWRRAAADNRRKVRIALASPAVVGIVLLLAGIAVAWLLIVGAVLLVGWLLLAVAIWRRATTAALSRLGGTAPPDAASKGTLSRLGAERLADLTEGLCAALGLSVPTISVLPDRAPNALAVGRSEDDAGLVVTAGLVELLDRIELEAVVAHELAHVKRLDIAPVVLLVGPLGGLVQALGGDGAKRALLGGPDREVLADLAAVSTTRYPPALIAALERVSASGGNRPSSVGPGVLRRTEGAWLVPFRDDGDLSLDTRLDVLREL